MNRNTYRIKGSPDGGTPSMNAAPGQGGRAPGIPWRGKQLSLPAADALANQERNAGRLAEAAKLYKAILREAPGYAELHNNLGVVLLLQQRHEAALPCFDEALRLKPAYANAHFNRACTLRGLGRADEALAGFELAVQYAPDHLEAHHNRGVLLREARQYDAARAAFDRCIALNPRHAEAYLNRGLVHLGRGRLPEAEADFLRAIDEKPDFAEAWLNLTSMRTYDSAAHEDARRIRELLARPGLPADQREPLGFALGKILDAAGAYPEAFECFRRANQLRNARTRYDRIAAGRLLDELIATFRQEFLGQFTPVTRFGRGPIFIIGMPRSGTTLLGQILSNHPAIAMAGELAIMQGFASGLAEWTPAGAVYPRGVTELTSAARAGMAAVFEGRLRRDCGAEVPYVIDKNPLNFLHVGLIRVLFPEAPIIHCARNAWDTCLSTYFQRFPLALSYAFDLDNIGHFYAGYERLMQHWRNVPAVGLLEVRYEDLIWQTETAVRRLLDALGLAWDPRCLLPHTNPGVVETASQWQVRQQMYASAIGRWKNYAEQLEPLWAWLEPARATPANPFALPTPG